MAKFVEKVEPKQATYIYEFTQEEVDVLAGLVLDLTDRGRKVQMDYTQDESVVTLSNRGFEVLKPVALAFEASTSGGLDYDYFEFWDEVGEHEG